MTAALPCNRSWHSRQRGISSLAAWRPSVGRRARWPAAPAPRWPQQRRGRTKVGQPVERLGPILMWQQTSKRSFRASSVFACPFPERVFPVAGSSVADMPQPAINAFKPSTKTGLIPRLTQATACNGDAAFCTSLCHPEPCAGLANDRLAARCRCPTTGNGSSWFRTFSREHAHHTAASRRRL